MCLIAFSCKVHPEHPLLLVANRDEFHARPAAPLAWWDDQPQLLAGRDLQEGGSWLGVSRDGRAAAVTNVRSPDVASRKLLSRGRLVADFLAGTQSAETYGASLCSTANDYGGFNLLLFDGRETRYLSNHPQFESRAVEPGVHSLSNAQLDTPWPKSHVAQAAMHAWLARDLDDPEALLAAMADRSQAPDAALPHTGVGLELERMLSSAFIRTPGYGTRCTSLLRVARDGAVELFERRFDASGAISGETRERFQSSLT